jgi:hypothetical protein
MNAAAAPVSWIQDLERGLCITIPERFSDDEFNREFDEFSRRLRDARPGISLLVVVEMKTRSRPENRARAKQFFVDEKALFKNKVKAVAMVSDHVAIRGAISGVSLLGLFPFRVKTFESVALAKRWLETC